LQQIVFYFFEAKRTAYTSENKVYLRTYWAPINVWMLQQFSSYTVVGYNGVTWKLL